MAWGVRLGSRWALVLAAVAGVGVAGGVFASALYGFLRGGSPVLSAPSGALFVGLLLTVVSPLAAVGVVVFAVRHRDVIEEVFLVHRSGLLLVHFSKTLKAEKDRDIVVAMLTALQSFVQEAFSRGGSRNLRQMDFGNRKILIGQGVTTYLAVVLRGRPSLGLRPRMRRTVERVEDAYRDRLVDWNGNTDNLVGADEVIRAGLLVGGFRGLVESGAAVATGLVARFDFRREGRRAVRPAPPPSTSNPQEDAATLLDRPEIHSLQAEFRDMMTTALQQVQDGRFTLVGVADVYMTLALQKVQKPALAGWWNAVLQTVREVLRTWPWDPESQAWVRQGVPPASGAIPTPAPVPIQDLLGKVATLPMDAEAPALRRSRVGGSVGRARRSRHRSGTKPSPEPRRPSDD